MNRYNSVQHLQHIRTIRRRKN